MMRTPAFFFLPQKKDSKKTKEKVGKTGTQKRKRQAKTKENENRKRKKKKTRKNQKESKRLRRESNLHLCDYKVTPLAVRVRDSY